MQLTRIQIDVGDLTAAGRFFTEVLLLPAAVGKGSTLRISVGRSQLVLAERLGPAPAGVHHLAFDVPAATFAAHRDWLSDRVSLLSAADGTTEFEGPPVWNSRSVYFEGPDRMVLELIARRNRTAPPLTATPQLLSVSEVGVAVPDVPSAVATLNDAYGLDTFGEASAEFAPVGDDEGLLIVVAEGRAWLPVFDVVATPIPLHIELSGVRHRGPLSLNPQATLTSPPSQ